MRKPAFCMCKNKGADQFCCNSELISAFVFATQIEQCLFFLNPKFQASSYLQRLYSLVCVGPGRKPRRQVLSRHGSSKKGRMRSDSCLHERTVVPKLQNECIAKILIRLGRYNLGKSNKLGNYSC